MSGDRDLLLEMGFKVEYVDIALKKTGGLQDAITWLDANQDKPLESISDVNASEDQGTTGSATDTHDKQAGSLVCLDCGKRFKNAAMAEFHATKTEHQNFEESTEEITPLSAEEKKKKLEDLKAKLAEKRTAGAAQDKEDFKKNELIRRKNNDQTQRIKEDLQKKEHLKEAMKRKQEKTDELAAKQRIREQIKADQEARRNALAKARAAREGILEPSSSSEPIQQPQPNFSKPAAAYTTSRLQVRIDGQSTPYVKTFPVESTLREVIGAIKDELGLSVSSLSTTFPRKVFSTSEELQLSLKEAGMVPSASIIAK